MEKPASCLVRWGASLQRLNLPDDNCKYSLLVTVAYKIEIVTLKRNEPFLIIFFYLILLKVTGLNIVTGHFIGPK